MYLMDAEGVITRYDSIEINMMNLSPTPGIRKHRSSVKAASTVMFATLPESSIATIQIEESRVDQDLELEKDSFSSMNQDVASWSLAPALNIWQHLEKALTTMNLRSISIGV